MAKYGTFQGPGPALPVYLSVALVAASVIAYQVNLVQVFSFVQWYHFAYMAISIALLGFGAAGTLLAVWRERILAHYRVIYPLTCALASISMGALMLFKGDVWWHFEAYHLTLSVPALLRLTSSYLVLTIPFLFGALALGMAFAKYPAQIGPLYGSDLAGSAIGAIMAVVMASVLLPHHAGIAIAVLPLAGCMFTLPEWQRHRWIILPVVNGLSLAVFLLISEMPQSSEYKPVSKALLMPDARIEYTAPHPQGVLQVLSSPVLRHAPGISMTYSGTVPVVKGVFRNGAWVGALGDLSLTDSTHIYDHSGFALPFALASYDRVLIAGDATGSMAQYVLRHSPQSLTHILPDHGIKEILHAPDTGAVPPQRRDPRIKHPVGHMRRILLAGKDSYDLVILPSIGQFGSTGQMATQEDYIFTAENLSLIWEHMAPDGTMVVSCWLDTPARVPLRVFRMLVELLRRKGVQRPMEHIISTRNWGMVSYTLRKQPWMERHYALADTFCVERHFDPLITRGHLAQDSAMLHTTEDSSFLRLHRAIIAGDEQAIEAYDFDLSVPEDRRPYFYNFVRIAGIDKVLETYGKQGMFVELGYFFVLVTFVCVSIIAFVLIILPLFRMGFGGQGRWFTLLYFAAIGIGYMCVEMAFLHRSIPYLGSPTTAFATTLAALLVASALGSYVSQTFIQRMPLKWGLLLIFSLLLYNLCAEVLWNAIAQSGIFRFALTALLIGIPGFFMGMFFPSGISQLSASGLRNMIPWAWGVNGFFSVISAVLALVLAMEWGFDVVIWVAAAAYVVALAGGRMRTQG